MNCLNIAEHLERHPVAAHRQSERRADRPAGWDRDYRSDHHEPGMVIDAGDHLAFPAIGQRDTADQAELPQVHRRLTLPPLIDPLLLLLLGSDQAVAGQHPMHRRPRRHRRAAQPKFVDDPPGTPPRMLPPQLADQGFDIGGQPGRATARPPRPVL